MTVTLNIKKHLAGFHLDVQLEAGNEVLGLLGASGSGKSMTLKCIAGVEKPDAGSVVLDEQVLFDSARRINLAPQKRRVGFLFQNYALFPQMTVLENIRVGARRKKDAALENKKVAEVMERFEISDLADHYPSQISGGQQQRTALARILVSDPEILLLDEPFSALDTHLRFRLERELREVARSFGKTVILVSHDRDEAFRLSDKIAVMDQGRVAAYGEKAAVFRAPATRQAAILTGCKNLSRMEAVGPHTIRAVDWDLVLEVERVPASAEYVGIRMHDIFYGPGPNQQTFTVLEEIENPFSYTIVTRAQGSEEAASLFWETDKALWRAVRAREIVLNIPQEGIMLLAR